MFYKNKIFYFGWMKKSVLFLNLIFFLIAFSSCEKRVCDDNNTATLIITNQTIHPIQFYFDGVYLYDMIELTTETLEVNTGAHTFGAKLAGSGYSDPLHWQKTKAFSLCEHVEYTFE